MRVLLTSEARFERTPDGVVWGAAAYGRALWSRYLEVFSGVLVAARVRDAREPSPGLVKASSPDVQFCPLAPYSGLSGLVQHLGEVRSRVAESVQASPAVIVRSPSPVAYLTSRAVAGAGRPYAAEIVGDPDGVFSPGAFQHPLRIAIKCAASAAQRHVSRHAVAALYVTSEALQRRYPTQGRIYVASDVALDDDAFASDGPRGWTPPSPFVLVTVGALDQPYKGTAILLDAVGKLCRRRAPVLLRIVGDGRLRVALQQQALALNLSDAVEFLGQQDRAGVLAALDSAHLFVLPSLTEGLPRALLEAMARGLPAVATAVGGVPELLTAECLVPPRQSDALAGRIEWLMADASRRCYLGERNRRQARVYHERAQAAVRREFFQTVLQASAGGAREIRCA